MGTRLNHAVDDGDDSVDRPSKRGRPNVPTPNAPIRAPKNGDNDKSVSGMALSAWRNTLRKFRVGN